jgi:subtilisin family serine protease
MTARSWQVVMYISYPSASGAYLFDYQNGHGTHVAGTVAGRMVRDADYNDSVAELGVCGNAYDTWEQQNSCADFDADE